MSEVKRGLGRGLSALFSEVQQPQSASAPDGDGSSSVQMMDVAALSPNPGQPRRHFD